MAKTSYLSIPSGSENAFYNNLKSTDRFFYSKLARNDTLLSKKRKKGVSQKSLLPTIAALWNSFDESTKAAWNAAGVYTNLNGWRLFTQDQCIRIKNDMGGVATPSDHHQSWVGEIKINAPATEIKIAQIHPHSYYVSRKITGTKSMYQPVEIIESLTLPLQIGIGYQSNLVAVGPNPYAKLSAVIWNSYQGRSDDTELKIDFDLVSDWQTVTATLNTLRGTLIGYTLYLEFHDLQGEIYFDNIKALHGGVNWVRDFACTNIAQTFTKQWFQIPSHWVALILPNGAEYDTVYKDF